MALYITQADLEGFIGPTVVAAIFDDDNSGAVSQTALTEILTLACFRVDAKIARVYSGPFPLTTVPQMVKHAALLFAKALSYERSTEYVRQYGDAPMKAAKEFIEEVCEARAYLTDNAGQPVPLNVGGIVTNSGPRVLVDSPDGTSNGGDF